MKRAGLLILACFGAVPATAQSGAAGFFNPLSASRDGIHLYNVSVYTGFFSGGIPFEVSTIQTLSAGSTAVTGGSASLGWSRTRDGSSLAVSESLSYMAYPERLLQPNTRATLNWNRKIGQRWSINMAATAQMIDLQQSYFAANAFGLAAALPTTFDGLAGAMLKGTFTDAQLASALTGASAPLLPEQAYLYGQHVGSVSATLGASYAPSGRSSFNFSVMANRTQTLNIGESTQNPTQALIPRTTTGTVSLGWGYSLSPRTQIGLGAGTSRIFSNVLDEYTSTAEFSIGRTMSEHWFVRGMVGSGFITYLRQPVAMPNTVQYTAGGSLGYKLRSHTLLGSFNRLIGDSYGLGAGSTNAAMAGWTWKAPGSSWSVSANYNYQQLNGSGLLTNASWRAVGGIARALGPHVFVSVQYTYFKLPPTFLLGNGTLDAQSGVTMSLSWSPSQYR